LRRDPVQYRRHIVDHDRLERLASDLEESHVDLRDVLGGSQALQAVMVDDVSAVLNGIASQA
jgi:hypothetical protein